MTFKFKAYNTLLRELGRNDYVVEIAELAMRDFLVRLKDSNDEESYLKEMSEKYGVMVSFDKSNSYYNQITLGHISNVYHITETFFYELKTEYNELTNEQWTFEQGKTKLNQVIDFISKKGRLNNIDKIESYLTDTFNYYHQLRVYFSHKKTTSENEIENKWKTVSQVFTDELLKKYRVKSCPKLVNDVDFEDFFLFTQIAKELALKLSSFCYPDAKPLAEVEGIKRLKKYINEQDRLRVGIVNYLKTEYGFENDDDSNTLIDEIINEL